MKGKFKERIEQESEMNDCDAFDVGCDKVDADEMLKMVDEARTTWPRLADMVNKTKTPLEGIVLLMREREEWFKEHFGDEGK